MNKEESKGESCPACAVATSIGMYLNICKELDSKETCEELFKKVINEDISPQELFDLIKEKAKDKPEELETLKYIDELVEKAKKELNDKQ